MDKLILTVHRSSTITSNLVRLPDDAIEIVRQIQLESGLSASSIVAQILTLGAKQSGNKRNLIERSGKYAINPLEKAVQPELSRRIQH